MTRLKCVNADGQPRLQVGGFYTLALDVHEGSRPGNPPQPASGYIVMAEGDTVAIPYVYDRSRFEIVKGGH